MVQNWNCPVGSLLSLSVEYIVNNLHVYSNDNLQGLKNLPLNIKDRILRKFTITSFFWKRLDFKETFKALVHSKTQHIDLTSVYIDDDILQSLEQCTNLKNLYLTKIGTHNITSGGLINLLSCTRNIVLLYLQNCTVVNDEVLECISSNCPSLSILDLGGCRNITDKGVQGIANMSRITALTLSYTKVSNDGIQHLVKGKSGGMIKELRIDNCPGISERGLLAVAENCPNIQVLIFYNCSPTKDNTISILEEPNLKNLKQVTWTISW